MNDYGIDVNTIQNFIKKPNRQKTDWGFYSKVVSLEEYELERIDINKNKSYATHGKKNLEATIFVESGSVLINKTMLGRHEVMSLQPSTKINISAKKDTTLYIFFGPVENSAKTEYLIKKKTSDCREKYWGNIQTIVNKN